MLVAELNVTLYRFLKVFERVLKPEEINAVMALFIIEIMSIYEQTA